ncbi:exodeoxyribonuclease V subunit alpha [Marinobacter sp.]|uniref:exodeoxyribonuclease V subunit alpha n=1 Tax=Marinobacter sp. TaxID=50741 RepID=UPI0019B46EB9|nr:exodeoxyribonuclease V subunit alpha [Marinobacter sp.]MBC7191968.1 exodeoxyribonuclease V subunit alpha [Marinobacter sp.]
MVYATETVNPPRPMASAQSLLTVLDRWVEQGWLRALDQTFAVFLNDTLTEQGEQPAPALLLLAALVSHQVGRGHVCLDLEQLCGHPADTLVLPPEGAENRPEQLPLPATLLKGYSARQLLGAISASTAVGDGGAVTPLVLDGSRLYLYRFWRYEGAIAEGIAQRLAEPVTDAGDQSLAHALDILFPQSDQPDYQKIACALAARSRFSVITGGPGTGKTTTVVRLLAALQSVTLQTGNNHGQPLKIRLAAPTGKAAARLSESIAGALDSLPLSRLPGQPAADTIPARVTTLHRLLGSRPGTRHFRHNEDNPLPLDILVIDEASMVDVDLMASVFAALPAQARLVMLGDKDQLASVDAGAVLGELCQRAAQGHYLPDTLAWLRDVTGYQLPDTLQDQAGYPLDQAVAMLRVSHRFDRHSGIGQLARAINENRLDRELIRDTRAGVYPDLAWLPLPASKPEGGDREARIVRHALSGSPASFANEGKGRRVQGKPVDPPVGYRSYLEIMKRVTDQQLNPRTREEWDDWARSILRAFGKFQVLCPLRRGPLGVEGLNQAIAAGLKRARLIDQTEGWYPGRPVLITGNDYNLGLMNGDIGIALKVPWDQDEQGNPKDALRVAFPASDGTDAIRWISPGRLQSLETVYAMTVHKSQGSEFEHACLIVPDRLTPVLTRELVYTGITRARNWLSLMVCDEQVLGKAVSRGVIRASGLAGRLT